MREKLIFEKYFCLDEKNWIVQSFKTIKSDFFSEQGYIEFLFFDCQTYYSKTLYLTQAQSFDLMYAFKTDITKAVKQVKKMWGSSFVL